MQNKRTLLFFVLLFGLGAVAGSSISRGSAQRETAKAPSSYSAEAVVNRFLERKQTELTTWLGLSPEQLDASAPALEATRAKLIAHQTRARAEVFSIMEEYRAELAKNLTPEQRTALDKGMEKYRKKSPAATPAPATR
jgi:Spy/CpxP family protein refolding chaperone